MKNIGVDQCYLKGLKKYEEIMIIALIVIDIFLQISS